MLSHLHIRHFAIIDSSELELTPGMTALTGETGAGKSILLDALGLVLGARASAEDIQAGASRADITATFSLEQQPQVMAWLADHDLLDASEDASGDSDVLVRRTLTTNGKSRAAINDTPVSVQMLKQLGEQLVSIHGQHAHQTLANATQQRELLDNYSGTEQARKVQLAFEAWQQADQSLRDSASDSQARQQRTDLLQFQLQEFDELDIGGESIEDIESEHRWLASSERILSLSTDTLSAIDDTASPALNRAVPSLTELVQIDERLREALDLVESASIQVAEATQMIRHAMSRLEHDDNRMAWLDQKLSALHRLARKHQCEMSELPELESRLRDELDTLTAPELGVEELERQANALKAVYDSEAAKLTRHRKKHAKQLGKAITEAMQSLNMTGGVFQIAVEAEKSPQPRAQGADVITFLVSPNPGVAPAPLSRVASGGELSRISLCLQLATLDVQPVPTLVFDEVDSGVGGAVAETVGRLLRRVGSRAQVLCVTHLPQVAAQAHHHLLIKKSVAGGKTKTAVTALDKKGTLDEIARMLGGAKITTKSRQHAKEMLGAAVESD